MPADRTPPKGGGLQQLNQEQEIQQQEQQHKTQKQTLQSQQQQEQKSKLCPHSLTSVPSLSPQPWSVQCKTPNSGKNVGLPNKPIKVQTGIERYTEIVKRKLSPQKNANNRDKIQKVNNNNYNNYNNRFKALSDVSENIEEIKNKIVKPPPIYVREKNSSDLVNSLSNLIGKKNFFVVPIKKGMINETKVQVSSEDQFRKVIAELEIKSKQFYTKITIEEPHKRNFPVQCFNCQEYGHTKSYCKLAKVCVICAKIHSSDKCPESKENPAVRKCSNCGDSHTANYRGCPVFTALRLKLNVAQRQRTPQLNLPNFITSHFPPLPQNTSPTLQPPAPPMQQMTYANATKQIPLLTNSSTVVPGFEAMLASFTQKIEHFMDFMQNMMNSLMQSMIQNQSLIAELVKPK
ncbi:uncharacterized protein LOC119675389 [Teleopsis dalmanni]|uniref:uncharacterized protein LOC119675389 n=1 Tax=Teleopsis dalmanni TaxID=139649 RepID=UPI0018CDA575|nr:uncharacterized protein LOC119675389 [Teleopsis dalmanni]